MIEEFRSHSQRIFNLDMTNKVLDVVHHNICKLNLSLLNYQRHQHCQGWNDIVDYLQSRLIHNDQGTYLLDFFDNSILCPQILNICQRHPWIGFVHMASGKELSHHHQIGNKTDQNTLIGLWSNLKNSNSFRSVFDQCQGLFVLSKHLQNYLEEYLPSQLPYSIPVEHYYHPKDISVQFQLQAFMNRKKRKLVHIGKYLRNFESFQRLKVPNNYIKHILNFSLNNHDYLQLLTSSIVFVNLYDASASNLIVECLLANVPIMINPLPSVIEYLGEKYPFYYHSLEEATLKLTNDQTIIATYHYLSSLNKTRYSLQHFYHTWLYSSILTNINHCHFPVQKKTHLAPTTSTTTANNQNQLVIYNQLSKQTSNPLRIVPFLPIVSLSPTSYVV